jgi:hypothetical protein
MNARMMKKYVAANMWNKKRPRRRCSPKLKNEN